LLSLDISKAFDSISHRFLELTLEFLNFGPNFIRWIKLVATNRFACIILSNNTCGEIFALEKGNAQGDTISPFLFIICFQFLIYKLEFDVQIEGIPADPGEEVERGGEVVRVDLPGVQAAQGPDQEVAGRLHKRRVFAFADDGNIVLKLTIENLRRVSEILQQFGQISGLKCNLEKTNMLIIGENTLEGEDLQNIGFNICENLTIPGAVVGKDSYKKNTEKIVDSLNREKRYWERFSLSLPGRITIAKAMLYSQLNYLGCFIDFKKMETDRFSAIIENYVRGNLNISKKRIFMEPKAGGLGLFNVETFLKAQKCSWVKRAISVDEDWKYDIMKCRVTSPFHLNPEKLNKKTAPVTYEIAKAFAEFSKKYWEHAENFREAPLFSGNFYTRLQSNEPVTLDIFEDLQETHLERCMAVNIKNIQNGDRYTTMAEFEEETGIPINLRMLRGLRAVYDVAEIKFKKSIDFLQTSTPIEEYMRFKKGSKKYRRILDFRIHDEIPHNMVKFASNMEVIIGLDLSRYLNGKWNTSYYSNSFRVFLFKFYNNSLGYNYMVSRFVGNVEPYCTFCLQENETPLHLFFTCRYIEPILNEYFMRFGAGNEIRRTDFFTKFTFDNEAKAEVLFLLCSLARFYIWEMKLRKNRPNINEMTIYIREEVKTIQKISGSFNNLLTASGLANNLLQG